MGNENCEISLFQYVDDTIFVGEVSVKNVFCLKAILRLFELISELRVNFHKNSFGAIGVEVGVVEGYASMLNCEILSIAFIYFRLPIGINPRRIESWQPVVRKFEKR